MLKTKVMKHMPFLLTVFISTILISAVLFLMNYVQRLLDSDIKINLTEIVTQNKDVISSKLKLEVNNLEVAADQLAGLFSQAENLSEEDMKSIFLEYANEKNDDKLFWASNSGIGVFQNGQEFDISGRRYFLLSSDGVPNISDRMVSRLDGEDIFVISVPMIYKDNIVGTVQKLYSPQQMYNLCSVSLFSAQGYMYIVNSLGYILISSNQNEYSRESDNYYRMVYLNNPEASRRLQQDIANNQGGFMETVENGQKIFSAYTPIAEVYDWYLISSVSMDAVSPNANIVIKLFYCVLFVVVLIFSLIMAYFFYFKNKQQANLERIAFVDTVTQGDTYTKFLVNFQEALECDKERHFYIFAFDIDNFKYINSYYGFDFGDKVLKGMYNLFAHKLRANEYIARVYSDHFVVLLEDAAQQRLESLFSSDLKVEGVDIYLSAGLYTVTEKDESISLMVDKANMAAQKIKGVRYKQVEIYSEEFDQEMTYNEQLKRSVEQALAESEIIPYFQPKVDVNTRKLVGAEALARWRKKDGSLIPPDKFVPVCEKNGLIVLIDMVIFEKTLQFIRHNLDMGVKCVPISVNFSRLHLQNKNFIEQLLEKFQQYDVPLQWVELELTETVLFDNAQIVVSFIDQLHRHGLQISMDDFGSGYSSLQMLKDIDIDVLKIDRGFLQDTQNSDRQKAVFAAITQMAQKLNIKVVVEGVENIENVALMKEFNCNVAQGYFFARPMDEKSFDKIFKEGIV